MFILKLFFKWWDSFFNKFKFISSFFILFIFWDGNNFSIEWLLELFSKVFYFFLLNFFSYFLNQIHYGVYFGAPLLFFLLFVSLELAEDSCINDGILKPLLYSICVVSCKFTGIIICLINFELSLFDNIFLFKNFDDSLWDIFM